MKDKVIRIVSRADGAPTRYDGLYVVAYDPARPGTERMSGCYLVTTDAIADARRFDAPEAWEYWMQSAGVRTWDGQHNRPLTAYTIEVVPADGTGPALADLLKKAGGGRQ